MQNEIAIVFEEKDGLGGVVIFFDARNGALSRIVVTIDKLGFLFLHLAKQSSDRGVPLRFWYATDEKNQVRVPPAPIMEEAWEIAQEAFFKSGDPDVSQMVDYSRAILAAEDTL